MFDLLAQINPTIAKTQDTANQVILLLQTVIFPLFCIAALLGVLIKTRAVAAVLGAVFPLAIAAIFVYNPSTFQTVGSWFI